MKKIYVIINDNSGRGTEREGMGSRIGETIRSARPSAQVFLTKTLDELDRAVSALSADRSPEKAVILAAGDGGLHHLLFRLSRVSASDRAPFPAIGLVSSGSMNLVAAALGLGIGDSVEQARKMAESIDSETANMREFRTLKANGRPCFVFGIGLPVRLLEGYYSFSDSSLGSRIVQAFVALAAREAGNRIAFWRKGRPSSGFCVAVRLDPSGEWGRKEDCTGILASTIDRLGFNCQAMPAAEWAGREGKFLLRNTALSVMQFFNPDVMAALWYGQPLPKTSDVKTNYAEIGCSVPVPWTADGEMFHALDSHRLEVGPAVRFMVP